MDLKAFWLGWRRDIIRFVALCSAALVLGLITNHLVGRARQARQQLTGMLPRGLGGLMSGLDDAADSAVGPLATGDTWTYRAPVAPRQWVWIRDRSGSVTVEPTSGDSLEVSAVKRFGHSDPGTVRIVAAPGSDGITICALWGRGDRDNRCGPGEAYHQRHVSHNDVRVNFTVRLPRGVAIGATTVSGAVRVVGASAPVVAGTVSGDVQAETTRGPVNAYSVNGSVRASMRGFADTGQVKVMTVNGAVTVELPARIDAAVDANTVNGAIESDFPLTVGSKFVAHHAAGTLGTGGRRIELNSVNGSIRLKRIGQK